MNDNSRKVWSHDSTQWGLIQLRLQREREEQERIEASKSDIDRIHEDARRRVYDRANNGDGVTQPDTEAQEKINRAQQVDESKRVYWRRTENGFEQIRK
jgi:hypothetical protein